MPSPFAPFENALIVFDIPTGVVTKNALGNRVTQTAEVEIRAMLKPVKDAAEVQYYIGDDNTAELMSGYLTNPLRLPPNLHAPIEGRATIKTALGKTEVGTFELKPNSQSPYVMGVKMNFIHKIIGVFRRG